MHDAPDNLARYHRQMLLPGIGDAGQRKLLNSTALIAGCGALGCAIADALVRAGVGRLIIIDRDIVELTNLQRQTLFTERDAAESVPKAIAAKQRLMQINSQVNIIAHVDDLGPRNCERLSEGADIILDGLDNFETRYLLNDLAVNRGLPYVYAGAVGTTAMSFAVVPSAECRVPSAGSLGTLNSELGTPSPCLRCIFPDPPAPGSTATCDTAGVLGPAVMMIAAHQAAQAIKLLSGSVDSLDRFMLWLDLWSNEMRRFDISNSRNPNCPCCGQRDFQFLRGDSTSAAVSLCGRHAVQIGSANCETSIDLATIASRLAPHGEFTHNEFLLRGTFTNERGDAADGEKPPSIEIMLFPNGRAIIRGTERIETARSIYARYIGA